MFTCTAKFVTTFKCIKIQTKHLKSLFDLLKVSFNLVNVTFWLPDHLPRVRVFSLQSTIRRKGMTASLHKSTVITTQTNLSQSLVSIIAKTARHTPLGFPVQRFLYRLFVFLCKSYIFLKLYLNRCAITYCYYRILRFVCTLSTVQGCNHTYKVQGSFSSCIEKILIKHMVEIV